MFQENGFPQNYGSRGGKSNHSGLGRGNSSGKGSKLCTYCGFTNLTVDEYYRKHGYPPRHKYQKSQSSNINNMNVLKEEGDGSALEQNQDEQNTEMKLTPQQYKALMALLQQQSSSHNNSHVNQISTITGSSNAHRGNVLSITCSVSKTGPDEWILNSEATDHVITFPYLFSSCKKINPIILSFPLATQSLQLM